MIKPYDPRFTECTVRYGYNEPRARIAPNDSRCAWRFTSLAIQAHYIPPKKLTPSERAWCGAYVPVRVNGVVGYVKKAAFSAWEPLRLTIDSRVLSRQGKLALASEPSLSAG